MEAEEILTKFVASHASKSYYRLDTTLANFYAGVDKTELVVKGVHWSSLSSLARESLKQLFSEHLTSEKDIH